MGLAGKRITPVERLLRLICNPIEIAIDTEFEGVHTLCVQAATRVNPKSIMVQLFRSPSVPPLPKTFEVSRYLPTHADAYGKYVQRISLRPVEALTRELSPTRMLAKLLKVPDLKALSRREGERLVKNADIGFREATWDSERGRWKLPKIKIILVGHFLTADLGRIFGQEFYRDLFSGDIYRSSAVTLESVRKLTFSEPFGSFSSTNPVIEYAMLDDDWMYEVHIETRDTMLPFGTSSLDRLSRTFLELPKLETITSEEKKSMLNVFKSKTHDAYGYSIVDAVNTLLVYEQMKVHDRAIYSEFEVASDLVPEMAASVGGRVRDFLMTMTRKHAGESQYLSNARSIKELMHRGGLVGFHGAHSASRFGPQTGLIHGGLLFTRTPTKFWHEGEDMFRDVDFAGCYNNILANMNVYWGRPLAEEPGSQNLKLVDAVRLVRTRADDDAWYIRVTGDLSTIRNTLIPSALDATTRENYRSRKRKAQAAAFRGEIDDENQVRGGKLFSHRIESGVVTMATWLMIQALPPQARQEYENLRTDSMVYYLRDMVAEDGPEYDAKVQCQWSEELPWQSHYCDDTMQLIHREDLDQEHVALRFPIGEYARQIGALRTQAKEDHGKESGQEFALKMQANTMFGVLVCRHHATNNVVAGNQVTTHARAEAWAMMQSLNGLQVITDGCSYRRDRIPACTLRECLEIMPDYPLQHADERSGIPFCDPADVPLEDIEFTQWYREHVKSFLGVAGDEYDRFFDTHQLDHKRTGKSERTTFDAITCDGNGNYLKLVKQDQGWSVADSKLRGYRPRGKQPLEDWILKTYSADQMDSLPPIIDETLLLKLKPARQKAKRAIVEQEIPEVLLPLGLEMTAIRAFKILKPSAFIFRDPGQLNVIARQIEKFQEATGCGLDLVILRQPHGKRGKHSLTSVADEIYRYIQEGGRDLAKKLNLRVNRLSKRQQKIVEDRRNELHRGRSEAENLMLAQIDLRSLSTDESLTGIVVASDTLHLVQ